MSLNQLQDFYKKTISVDCGAGAGNIYVSTKPSVSNGYLVISPTNTTLREIIRYTGTGTDTTGDYVTVANASDRGLGGTTAQSHKSGESVRMNITSLVWADLITEITSLWTAITTAIIAGALNATNILTGITRLSVAPDVTKGTCTISIATPADITFNAHGLTAGDTVRFTTTGSLPTGLTVGTVYYVISAGLATNTFRLSLTPEGSPVNTSGTQSGVHTLIRMTPVAIGDNDPRIPTPAQIANIPTSGEKASIGGNQGVPSSSNKSVLQDSTTISGTDQSQSTQNGTVEVGEANATTKKAKLAQSFVPTKTKIRGVRLWKTANLGTFTGSVTISLQADSSGSPSGSDLATKIISNTEYNALQASEFEALFSSEYSSLVAGNTYWIVITPSTTDNTNHPNLGTNTAGGYASGSVKYWNSTDGWVAVSTIDLYFKTLEGNKSQVPMTNSNGLIPNDLMEVPSFAHFYPYGSATLPYSNILGGNDPLNAYFIDGNTGYSYPRNKAGSFATLFANPDIKTPIWGSPSGYNWGFGCACTIGDYTYISSTQSQYGGSYPGTFGVGRFDKNRLTNGVAMTFSGGTMGGGSAMQNQPMYTDGTYLYIYKGTSGTTWEKYSISGTTLTYVSDVTTGVNGAILVNNQAICSDGVNVCALTVSAGVYTLSKYSADGSSLIESSTVIVSGAIWGATSSSNVLGITAGGVGKVFLVVSITFSTATVNNTGGVYYYVPISTS